MKLSGESIVRAAADLADEAGIGAVTMSALARHFGVRSASLYGHVRDQQAVLDGVHEQALDELGRAVAEATAGRSGHEAVRALADATRDYALAHPGRWAVLQLPAAPAVRTSAAAQRLAGFNIAVFRGYRLRPDDIVHATRMLAAAVNGFIGLDRVGAFGARSPDPADSWNHLLSALDATFRSWAADSPEG